MDRQRTLLEGIQALLDRLLQVGALVVAVVSGYYRLRVRPKVRVARVLRGMASLESVIRAATRVSDSLRKLLVSLAATLVFVGYLTGGLGMFDPTAKAPVASSAGEGQRPAG